jgi:hypothetical protein
MMGRLDSTQSVLWNKSKKKLQINDNEELEEWCPQMDQHPP